MGANGLVALITSIYSFSHAVSSLSSYRNVSLICYVVRYALLSNSTWIRVILDMVIVAQLVCLLWRPQAHCRVYKSPFKSDCE
jgi:hypothetical protein